MKVFYLICLSCLLLLVLVNRSETVVIYFDKKKTSKATTTKTPEYSLPVQKDCGLPYYAHEESSPTWRRFRRIVNGREAQPHNYPFLASIRKYDERTSTISEHFCGGSLIYERYVLTAAHCLIEMRENELIVMLGIHDRQDASRHALANRYRVVKIIRHERFNYELLENDVALLKLDRNVTMSRYVNTVCLPQSSSQADYVLDKHVQAAGWGRTSLNDRFGNYLQETWLTIINGNPLCVKYSNKFNMKNYYCAYDMDRDGSTNVCFGDSGSPIFMRLSDGRFYSFGILSFVFSYTDFESGKPTCLVNGPSFFTRIPLFLDWIAKKMDHYSLV